MIKYVTAVQGVKSSWNNVMKYSSLSRKSNKLNGTYSVKGVIILKENKILGEAWPLTCTTARITENLRKIFKNVYKY
jgi:hypothetical protein